MSSEFKFGDISLLVTINSKKYALLLFQLHARYIEESLTKKAFSVSKNASSYMPVT